jgi:hypothetical protein
MNELLQQRIYEVAKKKYCKNCPFESIKYCKKCSLIKEPIDFAAFALQNQWISTSESLPPCPDDDAISEVSIKVIARTKDGVIRYAYYHHYLQQWFSAETSTRIDGVTHWMFVPQMKGGKE